MFGKRSARGAGSGSRSATKPDAGGIGNGLLACILTGGSDAVASRASFTHLRSMLALSPLANATAAIEMPGLQASMAPALNSALCLRRWRPAGASTKLVSMCPRKVKRTLDSYISAFKSICLCWLLTELCRYVVLNPMRAPREVCGAFAVEQLPDDDRRIGRTSLTVDQGATDAIGQNKA